MGEYPTPCARSYEVPAFQNQVRERDARIAELEAQLMRRRAPLSPETQQAIATARAAGQLIASTSGGLAFMNDGAEPSSGELGCPTCGSSGHASDVKPACEPAVAQRRSPTLDARRSAATDPDTPAGIPQQSCRNLPTVA